MSSFLIDVWNGFWAADAFNRASFLLSLTGLSVFSGVFGSILTFRRSRHYRDQAQKLLDANADLNRRLESASAEADRLRLEAKQWQPATWLARARMEREQGNEEKAIAAIDEGLARVRPALADCATALAGHHLSLIVGPNAAESLAVGTRFARIACDLAPEDPDAAFLLEEAQLMSGMSVDEVTDTLPGSFLPSDPNAADALIAAILARGATLFAAGHYRIVVRLYIRAELIARRAGFLQDEVGMGVQYKLAQALEFAGQDAVALIKLQSLLPLMERSRGAEHPDTLAARHLEVSVLNRLGDSAAALTKLRALLPLMESLRGAEHPDMLTTRYLEAHILKDLGDHAAAFVQVKALLPLMERVCGAEHRETLTARYLEAAIVDGLGDHAAALVKVQALLPVHERVHGAEHPKTLIIRHLEAMILDNCGDRAAALAKVQTLLPLQERVRGPQHPGTLTTQSLEADILNGMGAYHEALAKVRAILPVQKRVIGAEHPTTLATRTLQARILRGLGDGEAALAEVQALLLVQKRVIGIGHPETLANRALEAACLIDLGKLDAAMALLDALLPFCEARLPPTHPLPPRVRELHKNVAAGLSTRLGVP